MINAVTTLPIEHIKPITISGKSNIGKISEAVANRRHAKIK
jgi:hypothetical protein